MTDTITPAKTGSEDWVTAAKKRQAHEADHLAAVASGIGEYGIANACYRLAAILHQHAQGDYTSMTEGDPMTTDRGTQAYAQAHEYITHGNPGRSARWHRRAALRYLALTASPPLTRRERRAAKMAARRTP